MYLSCFTRKEKVLIVEKANNNITLVYYTSNIENESLEKKIRDRILKRTKGIPLISVSQKPIRFGKNICVGNVGISNQNAHRQLQIGAMEAKTDFIISLEADCLYPDDYFQWVPPVKNRCFRSDNVWLISKFGGGFRHKYWSESGQVVGREYLIKTIEWRLRKRGMWNSVLEHGVHAPTMFHKEITLYHTKPIINIKTKEGMHWHSPVIKEEPPVRRLHSWGNASRLRKELFG